MDTFNMLEMESSQKKKKPVAKRPLRTILVLFIVLAGALWFWLAQDPSRQKVVEDVYTGVQKSVETGDFEALLNTIRQTPAGSAASSTPDESEAGGTITTIPPTTTILPATNEQVSASQDATQDIPSGKPEALEMPIPKPLELPAYEVMAEKQDVSSFVGRQDDAVVRQDFVLALATWMVDKYRPASVGYPQGRILVSLRNANLRFGHSMDGIAYVGDDKAIGREFALLYFFTPDMLRALYQLYGNSFFSAFEEAAEARNLTSAQKTEMYALYARRFRGLSGVFERIATMPELSDLLFFWNEAQKVTVEMNMLYATAVFALDAAHEQQNITAIQSAELEAERTSKLYQKAIVAQAAALDGIIGTLRQNAAARLLDDGSLLYAALWVERRYEQTSTLEAYEDKVAAVAQASTIFLDITQHFEKASEE